MGPLLFSVLGTVLNKKEESPTLIHLMLLISIHWGYQLKTERTHSGLSSKVHKRQAKRGKG